MNKPKKTAASAERDPGLVALFGRSGKSYESNVSELLADLDAAAARTRRESTGKAAGVDGLKSKQASPAQPKKTSIGRRADA